MCGITGYSSISKIRTDNYYKAHLLTRHRGPDDEGFIAFDEGKETIYRGDDTIKELTNLPHINTLNAAKTVLGQRRLSIIDLSKNGHQPICFENLSMVYNGEIFNYIELREELEKYGYQFYSESDTEVVLKAYHKWGNKAFNRFNGMWSMAIYDNHKQSLTLCRDRFGIKPLFYSFHNNTIYFASEMKFIRAFADINYSVNQEAVESYLQTSKTSYSEHTFWNEISELEPAHHLVFQNGNYSIEKYWNAIPKERKYNDKEALEEFSHLFTDSIKMRMRSDVEVGTMLSGGLDSTTIVCTLKKLGLISSNDFQSFSAVFKEEEFSERKYIEETVNFSQIKSNYTWLKAEDAFEHLNKIQWHIEDPFRSLSALLQYMVYKDIKEKTKVSVLLNGQGADELFSGYSKHYIPFIISKLRNLEISKGLKEINLLSKNRNIAKSSVLKQLVLSAYKNPLITLNKTTYNEISFSPLREYLKYDDRLSMAHGLEARLPFMDYRLVEFALRLPSKYRIDNFTNKKIVRDYAKDIVPNMILNRKDKQGTVTPQAKWQSNELYNLIHLKDSTPNTKLYKYIDKKTMLPLCSNYKKAQNEAFLPWRIFSLNLWLENN